MLRVVVFGLLVAFVFVSSVLLLVRVCVLFVVGCLLVSFCVFVCLFACCVCFLLLGL